MSVKDNTWDVIVVGGGPAGISAAMVLARSRRKVLLIDEGKQRNLKSHGLHNFVTRDGILPPDFLDLAHKELANYPVKFIKSSVLSAAREENLFRLKDAKNKEYTCRKVLLATGVSDHVPEIPGMKELWGCAVFHCPFCDGYECKENKIGLYARKHNGYGMALALRNLSREVTLYTDGAFYLKALQRQQLEKRQIRIVTKRVSHLVHEEGKLLAVALVNGEELPCDYMFTHHGHKVHSLLLEQLQCSLTRKGAAITNRQQQTNVPGVYVAGDASIDMHFVVVASAEGVKAAVAIHNDLLQEENREAMKVKDL
jgi:thioredoxin reductase